MMKRIKINSDLERRINLYINGRLDDQQIEDLWIDLIQDESALDYLKTAANLKQLAETENRLHKGGSARAPDAGVRRNDMTHLISARQQSRTGSNKAAYKKRNSWYMAAAAALIIIAGSYGFLNMGDRPEAVQPIASIELDYYRSSDGTADRAGDEGTIREAIILANSGEHDQAIRLIEDELNNASDSDARARLFINAGSILYNTSLYEEAASRFEEVVELGDSDPLVRERAYWYLGNTYFQMNKLEDARQAFQDAYELNGAYSRVAQSYLRALAS